MPRHLTNINLNLLLPLRALLREKSVTKAAAQTGMSQPAMSHALRRLRALLDDDLLIRRRGGGSFELTPRAAALVRPLDAILTLIDDELFSVAPFDPAGTARTFTIAASSATAFVALREIVQRLDAAHPQLTLDLRQSSRTVDDLFDDPRVDLALIPDVLPTVHPRERLYEEEWVFVVARDHGEVGQTLTAQQIATLPHAVYEQQGLRTHAELLLESVIGRVHRAVVGDDFMSLFHLVAGTRMICLVQSRVAHALAHAAGLRIVDSPVALPSFGIDMVWNPHAAADGGHAWLRRALRESIADA